MNSELLLYVGIGALVLFALLFFIFRKKSRRQTAAYLGPRGERLYARPSRAVVDDDDDLDLTDELADGLSDAVFSSKRRPSSSVTASPRQSTRRETQSGSATDDGSMIPLMMAVQPHGGSHPHRSDDAPATANGYDVGHREVGHQHVDHGSHDTGYSGGGDSGGGGDGGGGGGGGD